MSGGKARVEPKGAAPPHFALDRKAPAQHFHEAGRDGQPQARAAIRPRRRAIGLREGVEDRPLLLRRDADSRIRHRACPAPLRRVPPTPSGPAPRPRRSRELDGIADQVDQDLAQTRGVAEQGVRHIGRDMAGELEALLAARRLRAFIVSSSVSRRLNSIVSKSSLPASILEKSRMSLSRTATSPPSPSPCPDTRAAPA